MARVAYIAHPDYERHVQGPGHPEHPERVRALNMHLPTTDIWTTLVKKSPDIAPREILELVHSPSYVDLVDQVCRSGGGYIDGVETGAGPDSFSIARRAVGAVTLAVDAVLGGEVDSAFCAVRPPGHHALRSAAMGFCLFNNGAIGARYAQERYGVERVFIVDWDFHHGNGTQAIFWTDPTVFYFSVHCYPAWPYMGLPDDVGEGKGAGFTLNAPLPPGAGTHDYLDVFNKKLGPALDDFRPDLVLISAGFDAHRDDPLSRMMLNTEDFRTFTDRVRERAERYSGGRIVSVLEGGYHPRALAQSVEAHLRGLLA